MSKLQHLYDSMKHHDLDSMFITSKANLFYFSNYYTDPHERFIGIYVTQKHDPFLIVPAMEVNDAKQAGWTYEIIGYKDDEDLWALIQNHIHTLGNTPERIGLEEDEISLARYKAVQRILPQTEIVHAQEMLAHLRVIKSPEEYNTLKQAAELADFGIQTGMQAIREGVTEMEILATIEYELKKQGVQEMSFNTSVLSGSKSASPHGTPGNKPIEKGDFVLFDLGVVYKGYCSDMTRTFAFHSVTDEQKRIYETVLRAEEEAIKASVIGEKVGTIDQVARNIITEAGYGTYFTHRIGHGLGIDVHEYPSMHANNTLPLAEGMCYTIEPGIYVPDVGGVRIEDMVFMTKDGAETLTKFPKHLQIIS